VRNHRLISGTFLSSSAIVVRSNTELHSTWVYVLKNGILESQIRHPYKLLTMMGTMENVLLKHLIKDKPTASFIDETSTVAYAIQTLADSGKQYLPVLSADKSRVEYMLSLFDLISAVVMHPEPHAKEKTLAYLSVRFYFLLTYRILFLAFQ
jgi:hypothetical protein